MNWKKNVKVLAVSFLSGSILFSANLSAKAAETENETPIVIGDVGAQAIDVSQLNEEQLQEYNRLKSEGYIVSISKNEEGYISVDGYKRTPIISKNKSQLFALGGVQGEQRFTISKALYYGLKSVGTVKGYVDVKYSGSTVSIVKSSLSTNGASAEKKSHYNGNPARVVYEFNKTVTDKSWVNTRSVRFSLTFRFNSNGTMSFSNPQSAK